MKPILLVEDNEVDAALVKAACQSAGIPFQLHIATDGLKAVSYLAGDGPFANRKKHPLPQLVLLDISIPGMDGYAVLQWIRAQPSLVGLPVIMISGSNAIADIKRAYQLGATSFIRKGDEGMGFGDGMRAGLIYWLGHNVAFQSE